MQRLFMNAARFVVILAVFGRQGNARACDDCRIAALIASLGDKSSDVRAGAALELARVGPAAASAAPSLLKALEDQSQEVRFRASQALGRIGKPALKGVVGAVGNKEPAVRAAALHALAIMGPAAEDAADRVFSATEDAAAIVREGALEALEQLQGQPERYVEVGIRHLKDKEARVRMRAESLLASVGEPAVLPLCKLLENQQGQDRAQSVRVLRKMGPKGTSAGPALMRILDDPAREVRLETIKALGRIHEARAIPLLIGILNEAWDREILESVLLALAEFGPQASAAIPELVKALQSNELWLRASASRCLERIGAAAIPALTKVLENGNDDARGFAAELIQKAGSAGRTAVPALIPLLARTDSDLCSDAADALGAIGPTARAALPALKKAVSERNKVLRIAAAGAIKKIDPSDQASVRVLFELLGDPDEDLRISAMNKSLECELGANNRVRFLRKALADKSQPVRQNALFAAAQLGPELQELLPVLKKFVRDRDADMDLAEGLILQIEENKRARDARPREIPN